jgi:hypothetical protein
VPHSKLNSRAIQFEYALARLLVEAQWAVFLDSLHMSVNYRPLTMSVGGTKVQPSFFVELDENYQALCRGKPRPEYVSKRQYWIDIYPAGGSMGYDHLLTARVIQHDVPEQFRAEYVVAFGRPVTVDCPKSNVIQSSMWWDGRELDPEAWSPVISYFGQCTRCEFINLIPDWAADEPDTGAEHSVCGGYFRPHGDIIRKAMECTWDERDIITRFRSIMDSSTTKAVV